MCYVRVRVAIDPALNVKRANVVESQIRVEQDELLHQIRIPAARIGSPILGQICEEVVNDCSHRRAGDLLALGRALHKAVVLLECRLLVANKIVLFATDGDEPAATFAKPRFWRFGHGSNPPVAKETTWSEPKGLPESATVSCRSSWHRNSTLGRIPCQIQCQSIFESS